MNKKIISKILFLLTFVLVATILINFSYAYNITNDTSNYYITSGIYNVTISKTALLNDLIIDNVDYIGDDHYEGYDYIYMTTTTLGSPIYINSTSYINNTVSFDSDYASFNYTFNDNNITLQVSMKNFSNWVKLYAPINNDNFILANNTNNGSWENISDYVGIDAGWDNVTFTSNTGLKLSFLMDNATGTSTPGMVFYNNTIMWVMDNLNSIDGLPFYKNNNYTIVITIDNSSYVPPITNFSINITQLGVNNSYTINTTLYYAELSNCKLNTLILNDSVMDLLGDETQSELSGIYLSRTNPTTGILSITNSTYNSSINTITCFANNTNFTYTFFRDKILFDVQINQSGTWTRLYMVPNPDILSRAAHGRNSSNYITSGSWTNKSWEDVKYTTTENAKLRIFLKRDHPMGLAAGELNYYSSNMIYSIDNMNFGMPMQTGRNYTYVFSIDMNGFVPIDPNINVTINDTLFWYTVRTTDYTAIVSKEGVIKDLYFVNSTKDLLGDDFQDYFNGIYLAQQTPTSGVYLAQSSSTTQNTITFNNPNLYWKYTFYDDKIELLTTVNGTKYVRLYFTPYMDKYLSVRQRNPENASNVLNFTLGNYSSKAWPEVTYKTKEYLDLSLYLNNHPITHTISTEGQTNYYQGNQLWCLDNLETIYGGMPMEPGYIYKATLLFNKSAFIPQSSNLQITEGQNYMVYTSNYTAKINQSCVLSELRFKSSKDSILGYGNYSGLFLSSQNPNTGIIYADSITHVNNTIECYNSNVNWTYTFLDDEIVISIKNYNVTWLRLYAVSNKNITTLVREYNSTQNMTPANFSNKTWEKVEFTTNDNAKLLIILANDHNLSSAKPETNYYNQTIFYSIDNMNTGLPMYKNNYYNVKLKFNTTSYAPITFNEITYPRSVDGKTTRAIVVVNTNFTASNPGVSMPLIVALHPINVSIDTFFAQTGLGAEVTSRNWSMIIPEGYGRNSSPGNHTMYDISTDDLASDVVDSINQISGLYNINTSRIYLVTVHNTGLIVLSRKIQGYNITATAAYWPITNLTKYAIDINQSKDGNIGYYQKFYSELLSSYAQNHSFEYDRVSPIYYLANYNNQNVRLYHNPNNTLINHSHSQNFYDYMLSLDTANSDNIFIVNNTLNDTLANINATELLNWFATQTYNKSIEPISWIYDTNLSLDYATIVIKNYNPIGPNTSGVIDNTSYFMNFVIYKNITLNTLNITRFNVRDIIINLASSGLNVSNLHLWTYGEQSSVSLIGVSSNTSLSGEYLDVIFDSNGFIINITSNATWNFTSTMTRPYINNSPATINLTDQIWSNNILNFTLSGTGSASLRIPSGSFSAYWVLYKNGSIITTSNADAIILDNVNSNNYSLMADAVSPIVTLNSPSPNNSGIVNTSYFDINASFDETVTSCIININGVNYAMTLTDNVCTRHHTQNLVDATNQTYYVRAQDVSGNYGQSASITFFINWNNAPNTPSLIAPSNISYLKNNSVNLSWSASDSDNDNLTFTLNVTSINETFIVNNNFTSYILNLSDNNYNWTVWVADAEFNISSARRTFTVDTIPPSINITVPGNNTNQSQWQITMSYTPNETLSLCIYYLNGQATNVSCNYAINASQGNNNLSVYIEDLARNNRTTNISFYVDSIVPSITLLEPQNNSYNNTLTTIFNYSVNDASLIKNCSLWFNGVINLTNSSVVSVNNSFNATTLNGDYNWSITCSDTLNNTNTSLIQLLTIDTIIPSINLTYPINTSYGPREFNLSVSSNKTLSSCTYSLNSASYVNCAQLFNGTEGINNLSIRIVDMAGNNNSLYSEFYVNSTPPDINFMSPTPNNDSIVNVSSVTIRINSTNNLSSCIISFKAPGNDNNYSMTKLSDYICELNFTGLIDYQNYSYYIIANNTLGNINNTVNYTRTFRTVWNNAPGAVTLLFPDSGSYTNNASVRFNWTPSVNLDPDNITYMLVLAQGTNISLNVSYYYTNDTNITVSLTNESIYVWKIVANDTLLTNESVIYNFILDTTKANVSINISNGTLFSYSNLIVGVNTTENGTCYYLLSNYTNTTNVSCSVDSSVTSNISVSTYQEYNNLSIFVTDIAGNIGNVSVNFYVDSINPSINLINYPSNNTRTKNEYYNISFQVADKNLINCSLLINNTLNQTLNTSSMIYDSIIDKYNSSFSFMINNTLIQWNIACYDNFTHSNSVGNYNLQVDNVPPTFATSPSNNILFYNQSTINVNTNYTDSDVSSCMYIHSNLTDNNTYYGCNNTITLSQGFNSITMLINDTLNNTNSSSANITVDSITPRIIDIYVDLFNATLNSSGLGLPYYTNQNNHNITFYINDSNNVTCDLFVSEYILGVYTLVGNQTLNILGNSAALNYFELYINESKNWTMQCIDIFGNQNLTNGTILFKNTPPNVTIILPYPNTYVNRTNLSINTLIDLFDVITLNVSGNVSSNISYSRSVNTSVILYSGLNNVTLFVNDTYGNNITSNFSIYLYQTVPNITALNGVLFNYSSINFTLNVTENIPTVCILNISDYENSSSAYLLNLSNTSGFGFEFGSSGASPNLTILTNITYSEIPFDKSIVNGVQVLSVPLTFNDSIYRYNVSCQDYAGNQNRINGTFFIDANAPTITTNISTVMNVSLGDNLIFDVRAYRLSTIKYSITSYPDAHTQLNYTLSPNVPYTRVIFDTNVLDNNENYVFTINVTSSSGRNTVKSYNLSVNVTSISLNSLEKSLPYGVVNVNSVFTINYTSQYNISNVTIYAYGPTNFVLNNSNMTIKNITVNGNSTDYSTSFNYTFKFSGNYSFKVYLEDVNGNARRPDWNVYDLNYTVYAAQHNATMYVTSPNTVVNVTMFYGPLSYNMSTGISNLTIPNVPFGMNITTNESVMINIPQTYTNIVVGSMYIRKINDFTNQSYYNSSYFTNYNIHEVYYITVTNISNSHNVIFNLNGFSDTSRARIFKAPFNDVIITYSNDSIYTPTINGNTANITVSSFSIFVVLEDNTVIPTVPSSGGGGGGGSGGGGGGGGGAGPILNLNQTPVKNETTVNITQNITEVNKTVDVQENTTITTIVRENILKPYVDSLKENYLLIIWASLFLAVLAITSGYAAKSIRYRRYSKLNKDEKLQFIRDRFELASELLTNSRTATHEDKLRIQLLRARIANFVSKESEIMISEFDAVYKELEQLFKKYEE